MKPLIRLCALLLICAAIACKKGNSSPEQQLTTDKVQVTIDGHVNSIDSFNISYPGNWSISVNPAAPWYKLSAVSGTGNTKIYVTALQNNTLGTARSAALAVIPNGDESRKVNITLIQNKFSLSSWNNVYGGTNEDLFTSVTGTSDGRYLAAGYTWSNNGDVTVNKGKSDVWLVKLDVGGAIIWQKTYGGSQNDRANAIIAASDGGYILAGYTESNDHDITTYRGGGDVWILKIDGEGNKLWQKTYGGSAYDQAFSIISTGDGGYMLGCASHSTNGDITNNHGLGDAWLLKIDASGNKVWQKSYGGSNTEMSHWVVRSPDGGFVSAGYSDAFVADGDVQPTRGLLDIWVFKTDAAGNLLWQKTFGGSQVDFARQIINTSDGYIVAGYTASNDFQVTGFRGGSTDAWIFKLDLNGNLIWQKALGGTGAEDAFEIAADGNGYIFTGFTSSNNGDVTGNYGSNDLWVVRIDGNGNMQWQKTFGGTGDDFTGYQIIVNPDNSYTIAGQTKSNDNDITGNHGDADAWLISYKR